MKPIKIIKNKSKRKVNSLDPQKENIIKELAGLLETRGFQLRREPLKQGIGFKVLSGTCRINLNRFILLDRRLPQNEQISFLVGKLIGHERAITDEELSTLSEGTKSLFNVPVASSISCVS